MRRPAWCAQAQRLYRRHKDTFLVLELLQREGWLRTHAGEPANSVWKALHPELEHKWAVWEFARSEPRRVRKAASDSVLAGP